MTGAPPTREEFDRLVLQLDALNRAITSMRALTPAPPRVSSSVIADPNNFQRSPYAQPAPFDLTSKSGLLLYTDAQEALKVPFNGKAANVQPFLNSLALEVAKYCLATILESMEAYLNIKQLNDKNLLDYLKRYRVARDMFYSHIGAELLLPKLALRIKEQISPTVSPRSSIVSHSDIEVAMQKKVGEEIKMDYAHKACLWLEAYHFLMSLDKSKYGELIKGLVSQYLSLYLDEVDSHLLLSWAGSGCCDMAPTLVKHSCV